MTTAHLLTAWEKHVLAVGSVADATLHIDSVTRSHAHLLGAVCARCGGTVTITPKSEEAHCLVALRVHFSAKAVSPALSIRDMLPRCADDADHDSGGLSDLLERLRGGRLALDVFGQSQGPARVVEFTSPRPIDLVVLRRAVNRALASTATDAASDAEHQADPDTVHNPIVGIEAVALKSTGALVYAVLSSADASQRLLGRFAHAAISGRPATWVRLVARGLWRWREVHARVFPLSLRTGDALAVEIICSRPPPVAANTPRAAADPNAAAKRLILGSLGLRSIAAKPRQQPKQLIIKP